MVVGLNGHRGRVFHVLAYLIVAAVAFGAVGRLQAVCTRWATGLVRSLSPAGHPFFEREPVPTLPPEGAWNLSKSC